ncbi:MAG: tRNA (guanosine(46)-N7)-methyltransferase TrmB [Cystobacterineae bacterium]|nr:tRNA (guanosine(46)-N7)-methyltransferase TrmB [Cystobacterineae bacterium]
MSRIPLRLEPAGLEFVNIQPPVDWARIFGFSGPLELEIGCGLGEFALAYCQANPHVRYVAFEWRKKYARETYYRAQKRNLLNLKVLELDARLYIPKLFSPQSLSGIHLQFPDPWWKTAHKKRAILLPSFAQLLFSLLAPKGFFDLRTDVEERAASMLRTLENTGLRNPLGEGHFHPRPENDIPSSREQRYLITGQPVYRAQLFKPQG